MVNVGWIQTKDGFGFSSKQFRNSKNDQGVNQTESLMSPSKCVDTAEIILKNNPYLEI